MRINKFLAQSSGLSRRAADQVISTGRVLINDRIATLGDAVEASDEVFLDGQKQSVSQKIYIALYKPIGFITSRRPQGNSRSVYDLLPDEMRQLRYAGRLDKDTSGLLILTNDGDFIQEATHPSKEKIKEYEVELNKPLAPEDARKVEKGVELADGASRLSIFAISGARLSVRLSEGRNRQIRRTFQALGYDVVMLHRTRFGKLTLQGLSEGEWLKIRPEEVI